MTTENWMSGLDDNLTIDKISIPGTHDSGTAKCSAGPSHTQNFSISRQLNDGIRFLDIRVKHQSSNPDSDPLQVYHGIDNCDISFGDVLDDCEKFLTENPTETILMLMNSASGDGKDIQEYFDVYLNQTQYEELFYLQATLPKLAKLRSKIALFRRFPGNVGVDLSEGWKDNATFSLETPEGVEFYIEDEYNEHNTNKKLDVVEKTITQSIDNPNDGIFYITFNSIAYKVVNFRTPWDYAWGASGIDPEMNPALGSFLASQSGTKNFGIIPMDFYNKEVGDIDNSNVKAIVNSNAGVKLID